MTKEGFENWKSSQLTQDILAKLAERRENKVELLHELLAGCNDVERMAIQSARLQGMIMGYNELIEITWEDIE